MSFLVPHNYLHRTVMTVPAYCNSSRFWKQLAYSWLHVDVHVCVWLRVHVCFDDVIKWKHFPRYWPFVRGVHRPLWIPLAKASDVALWYCFWSAPEQTVEQTIAGDFRRHQAHCDVIIMWRNPIIPTAVPYPIPFSWRGNMASSNLGFIGKIK